MSSDKETSEASVPVVSENPSASTDDQITNPDPAELVDIDEYIEKNASSLLEYEKQMFLDTLHSDALVVCAKGITYERVLLNLLKIYCDPANLILVINCSDYEEKIYREQLDPKHIHDSATNGLEREKVYLEGGIQFITTRILVVDLLKKRIPISLITGIFVLRAHTVIESCQEAFALRLYRQHNKTGFVKAFSSNVEAFTFGYGHVEKVMRNLFITELCIWPRFHGIIQKSLKPYEPQVIEISLPMTQTMMVIQTHLLDIMNYLVKEIKRINRFIDMQEITVENCVTKQFHKILLAQLDTVWNQLSSQTKLLVSDLKVLRSFMISTIYSDAVSLYALIKRYRSQEYALASSGWVLLDSAEQIFNVSKRRVYNDREEFCPEPCPKWKALAEVLRVEIPCDIRVENKGRHDSNIVKEAVKVLILCSDARTCYQLNQYLTQGAEKYLFITALKSQVPVTKLAESYRNFSNSDIKESPIVVQKVETYFDKAKTNGKASVPKPPTAASVPLSKKLFKNFGKSKEPPPIDEDENKKDDEPKYEEPKEIELFTKEEIEESDNWCFRDSYVLTMSQKPENEQATSDAADDCFDITQMEKGDFESVLSDESTLLNVTAAIDPASVKPLVFIQTFKSQQNGFVSLDKTLAELQPKYIVMYHVNVTAIRQVEMYEARLRRDPKHRVKVFFLTHSKTIEEQSYLTSLRREKQAFELLIETKRKMVIPKYQDGRTEEAFIMNKTTAELEPEAGTSTRQAGGQVTNVPLTQKVIVDMREFRSDLPCLIHKRGMEVIPVTISIGDYILTPEICVERKSISDLIGSLNSGRLYNQCVAMTRYYAKPILLIEFDQNRPFHLQGHYMLSKDATPNSDITQKLQLLTIHFPKLRLVWSPSPYATAQLFEEMKQGKTQPEAAAAAAVGSDDATCENENLSDKYNPNVYDFLIKLPGINSKNIGRVMNKVKNLKELIKMSEEQLVELVDNARNAKMLWEIFHVAHKPTEANEKAGAFPSRYKRSNRGGGGFSGRR